MGKGTYAGKEGALEGEADGVSDMNGNALVAKDGNEHERVFNLV